MADSDLGAQFEKVSDKAKAATDKLKDADCVADSTVIRRGDVISRVASPSTAT